MTLPATANPSTGTGAGGGKTAVASGGSESGGALRTGSADAAPLPGKEGMLKRRPNMRFGKTNKRFWCVVRDGTLLLHPPIGRGKSRRRDMFEDAP